MPDPERVMSEALELAPEERTALAIRLLDSVEVPDPHGHLTDEELTAELRRRVEAIDRGEAEGLPWHEVRDRLRNRLGR